MHSLIDTHAHIYVDRFGDDLEEVIARAREVGIERIVVPATKPSEFERLERLANDQPIVAPAYGVHPHHAAEIDEADLDEVERRAAEGSAIAVGEIGLDYHYDFAPRDRQHEVFRRQLRIARQHRLPAIVHNRESDEDLLDIVEQEQDGTLRFQLHCFSSDLETLERALSLGAMISFTGNVTYKASTLDDVVRRVPDDRLMIETDSPYLTPVPHRGRRNEPAHVALVAERLATLRGVSIDTIRDMTTNNARRFFGLATLLLAVLLLLPSALLAQPEPVREIDTTARPREFTRLFGFGGHFASSSYISGSTTEANAIGGTGFWLTGTPLAPLGVNWLQLDVVYTSVEVPTGVDSSWYFTTRFFGDTGLLPNPNIHRTLDLSLRFSANTASIITFFGKFGVTKFDNTFGPDLYYVEHDVPGFTTNEESSWGWNVAAGLSVNIETPWATLAPTGEWSVMKITGERTLMGRTGEFLVSQPRIGLLVYPNFSRLFR